MTSTIHATAIVDPAAQLGSGVQVGPFAIIEADCRIGDGCEIRAHAVICRGTILGQNNQVGYGTVIGAEPQDLTFKGQVSHVEIGSENKIREHVTIHRASTENGATLVGNGNYLMSGVHLAHDTQIGNNVILANGTLLAGYVKIEDGVFLGGATILHQHVRIGRLAITRGGTRLGKDVPPYCMAVATNQVSGVNRLGMRRAGFTAETRRSIQSAYDLIYRSSLNVSQALSELGERCNSPELAHMIEFICLSKRGICRDRLGNEELE